MEAIVAFVLLSASISVATPLIVRHAQIVMDQRRYRLALDELTNQLDRLTALSETETRAELHQLMPGELVVRHLPGVQLTGELTPEELGSRMTLTLTWGGPGAPASPATKPGMSGVATDDKLPLGQSKRVALTGWILPQGKSAGKEESP